MRCDIFALTLTRLVVLEVDELGLGYDFRLKVEWVGREGVRTQDPNVDIFLFKYEAVNTHKPG
jgi:hypothetical protein